MKILVLTKRTLIIAAVVLLLLITAIILLLSFAPNAAAANSFRNVEEYELEVLAGKKRELPIYSVERSDKKIALTVDAAWKPTKRISSWTHWINTTFTPHSSSAASGLISTRKR